MHLKRKSVVMHFDQSRLCGMSVSIFPIFFKDICHQSSDILRCKIPYEAIDNYDGLSC